MKKLNDRNRLKHMLDAALDARKSLGESTFDELVKRPISPPLVGGD